MTPRTNYTEASQWVLSYLGLRKAIGYIAIALPLVLMLGNFLFQLTSLHPTPTERTLSFGERALKGSISAYYYTDMRNVFVGAMCAFGVFLISYRYGLKSSRLSTVAGFFSIGVALFPTKAPDARGVPVTFVLHLTCAIVLFAVLAFISFRLFPERTAQGKDRARVRQERLNKIYKVCGIVIWACLILCIPAFALSGEDSTVTVLRPILVLETAMILTFGVSWYAKGLDDRADLYTDP